MLLFNQLCVLIAFAATVSAFSVPMIASSVGRRRTAFASSSVYMSDAETASPELTSEEKASETAFPELTAEESAAKRKVQRDRHTMFVGNLPFGMFVCACDLSLDV